MHFKLSYNHNVSVKISRECVDYWTMKGGLCVVGLTSFSVLFIMVLYTVCGCMFSCSLVESVLIVSW